MDAEQGHISGEIPTVVGRHHHTEAGKFLQLWEKFVDAAVAFGRVLRRLRCRASMTQEQLGFNAELRRTYVSILELGQQQPSLSTILKIATALGCSAAELISLVESEIAENGKLQNKANI